MDTNDLNPEQASAEAVHKTKNAQQAVEMARQVQLEAILNSSRLSNTIQDAVIAALNRGAAEKKYIDIGRIPFICDDIRGIHSLITIMNENVSLVKKIVFGFIAAILLGVLGTVGTVVIMVLSHH